MVRTCSVSASCTIPSTIAVTSTETNRKSTRALPRSPPLLVGLPADPPASRSRSRRSPPPGRSEARRRPRPWHLWARSPAGRHLYWDRTGLCDRTELGAQDPVHGGLEHLAECLTGERPDQHHQSRRHPCHQHPSGYIATLRCGQCLLHTAPPPPLHRHTRTLHRSVSLSSLIIFLFSPDGVFGPSE